MGGGWADLRYYTLGTESALEFCFCLLGWVALGGYLKCP